MTSVTINIDLETKPGEPLCSRTIDIPAKANMLGFHRVIQTLFSWKDEHPYQFVSPKPFFVPGDVRSIVSRVGGEGGYPSEDVQVKDILQHVGDRIIYNYGDWRLTIGLTNTGGNQRKRVKMLEMKGPIPVENSRQAPGGWAAMWKALNKLSKAKTREGQHVIYSRMSKKERASVDFIGGVHHAYSLAAFRHNVGIEQFQKRIAAIDVCSIDAKNVDTNISGPTTLFTPEDLTQLSRKINKRMNGSQHMNGVGPTADEIDSVWELEHKGLVAERSHQGATHPLDYALVDEIIGESRSPWDLVLRIVEELSPYPGVADVMAGAMKGRWDADLSAAEIETVVDPLRECVRAIGSDEGKTTLDVLARQQWAEFSRIIGHDFSNPESQSHCLTAYLKAPVCFGFIDVKDESGLLTLTPLGRELLAEADFSMDEVERALANRKFFDQIVSKIPYDAGPFAIHMAARLGMLLAHEEMQQFGDSLGINPNQIYEETLHSLLIGLGIHDKQGISLINGYSDILIHFLEFSGLFPADLEERTQKLSAVGQRFTAMCLKELNYGRTIEGLKHFLVPVPVLY